MTYWIVPSNNKFFRLQDLLKERNIVFWRQMNRFEVGDVVYIYSSSPESRLMFQMKVLRVNIPSSDCDTQKEYWANEKDYNDSLSIPRTEWQVIYKLPPSDALSLLQLRKYGLKSHMQASVRIDGSLLDYIKTSIESLTSLGKVSLDDMPEIILESGDLQEGAKLQVTVNRYERNSAAREQCLRLKEYKCCVCGFDFEKTYGDIGHGFIHVHHVVPISEIGETYVVDPQNDLVPVCPNCHAMLHQRTPPYGVDEMKLKIGKNVSSP